LVLGVERAKAIQDASSAVGLDWIYRPLYSILPFDEKLFQDGAVKKPTFGVFLP
jgi:hypothetical protein